MATKLTAIAKVDDTDWDWSVHVIEVDDPKDKSEIIDEIAWQIVDGMKFLKTPEEEIEEEKLNLFESLSEQILVQCVFEGEPKIIHHGFGSMGNDVFSPES